MSGAICWSGWAAWASSCWSSRSCLCSASAERRCSRRRRPGRSRKAKLTPRIADTAKALYSVYFGISLVCFLAYRWAGMSWTDAFMHMCSTMGLGGFSSHDASFGYFDSPLIDYTAVVFMTIAGFNFSLHFVAWRRRSLVALLVGSGGPAYVFTLGRRMPVRGDVPVPLRRVRRLVGSRCATRRSTSFRSPRPPATRAPTTTSGRSSRRC